MHTIKPIISTVHLRTDPANVQCVWLVNNCPQTVWPMFTCSLPYIPVACGVIQYSGKRSWYWASPKRSPWTRNSLLPTAPTCLLMRSLWLISPSFHLTQWSKENEVFQAIIQIWRSAEVFLLAYLQPEVFLKYRRRSELSAKWSFENATSPRSRTVHTNFHAKSGVCSSKNGWVIA